jgi:hypothetical protein
MLQRTLAPELKTFASAEGVRKRRFPWF